MRQEPCNCCWVAQKYTQAPSVVACMQDWQSLRQAWDACTGQNHPDTERLAAAAVAGGLVLPSQANKACSNLGLCQRLLGSILPGGSKPLHASGQKHPLLTPLCALRSVLFGSTVLSAQCTTSDEAKIGSSRRQCFWCLELLGHCH